MMRLLREKTKIIMIIVAVSFLVGFIFFQLGVGGGGGRTDLSLRNVGVINDVEITYTVFQEMQNTIVQQLKEQGREDISDEEYAFIEEQAWNQLVYQILIQQEIDRRGIRVTDEEVRDFLINSPPEFIRTNESFQVNGIFSRERYLEFINAPEYREIVASLEGSVRENLPRIKLVNQFSLGTNFSDAELLQEYRDRKAEVRVGYVFFDPGLLAGDARDRDAGNAVDLLPAQEDPYQPAEEEIASYYREHREDFKDKERATLQYLSLSTVPTRKDTVEARDRAAELAVRIRNGEDFSALAQDLSADPSTADKGGDLGFLRKGEMLLALENVAFSLKSGEVSDPVRTPLGWHIVKVEERRGRTDKEEVHLRHILVPIKMSLANRDSLYGLVRDIFTDLRGGETGFTEVADRHHIAVKTTASFSETDFVQELAPIMREAAEFAFSRDAGAVSHSITRQGTIYILRIDRKDPERSLTLDEARAEIASLLSTEKKMAVLKENAESLLAEARGKGGLKEAAAAAGLEYRVTPPFTRKISVPGIGRQNAFVGYAHTLPAGAIGGPVKTDNGYYLIEVLERKEIDLQAFEKTKEELRKELITRAKSEAFDRWLSSMREEAEIEDNRLLFGYSG